ncbi:uncharacterized protein LOC126571959 isoform X2 [Anopheles aquasalis]|uniref:uncharacterized protein LOC126571959 isoform X2 n=1 Tax=Anopheles aquasalis TaxID=42839 RepID=UPI00215B6428|nr:uncharacterized protein LOC126571959 isoform X2 [Anopheles aquasalis]
MASSFCGATVIGLLALALAVVQGQKLLAMFDDPPNADDVIVSNEPTSLDDCHFRYYEYGKQNNSKPTSGTSTKLREYPHMAAIGWTQPDKTIRVWADLIRLGDINLPDGSDDEYAQQVGIEDIVFPKGHTFKNYYFDIALLELKHNVVLNEAVTPACLWIDDDIPFEKFTATGWGDTGPYLPKTPNLLQVLLGFIDIDTCNKSHQNNKWLPGGLHTNLMCASNDTQDTCQGDSGGPLQVKLLHNSLLTPFVVGVTSFGKPCGMLVPGAYVRVAPFYEWIKSTLKARGVADADWILEPQACARNYVKFRTEYELRVELSKTASNVRLDLNKLHLYRESSRQLVRIHWNNTVMNSSNECYGVIIDETTVLTLARCTEVNGTKPTHITFGMNKTNVITHTHRKDSFKEGSFRNSIGVLILAEPFEFNANFTPACVWTKESFLDPEMEVTGRGLRDLNKFFIDSVPEINRTSLSNTVDVLGIVMNQNGTNCSLPQQYADRLRNGLTQEHVCFGAKPFLVPRTCDQAFGGPLQREVDRYGRTLMYVNALNLFGRDCGFGESSVAVRLAHHRRWLESVLYPRNPLHYPRKIEIAKKRQPVAFLHGSFFENDDCTTPEGLQGVCVNYRLCPKVTDDFRNGGDVKHCNTESLLCCPQRYIRNEANSEAPSIDSCEDSRGNIDEWQGIGGNQRASFSNVVSIVWTNDGEERRCIGTIISSRTVLTAATCFHAWKLPSQVELLKSTGRVRIIVKKVKVHPEFNNKTKKHNVALIKTKDTSNQEEFLKPSACLWRNTTHTPFMMKQLVLVDQIYETKDAHLKYNTDCRRALGRVLAPSELCLKIVNLRKLNISIDDGMPAFWLNRGRRYLVGIVSRRSSVSDRSIVLYTRISSYIDWIKS